jgi:uncharacterized protein
MKYWVFDTNVLVSALLFRHSTTFAALVRAEANGLLLQSPATLTELELVLMRRKFDKYASESVRMDFLGRIVRISEIVIVQTQITACRDPKDNKFLELALDGYADAIISGDQDLLVLSPFEGIPILTPAQFLE